MMTFDCYALRPGLRQSVQKIGLSRVAHRRVAFWDECQAPAESFREIFQALEARITFLREHSKQMFPAELGFSSQTRKTTVSLSDMTQRQEKCPFIIPFKTV